MATSLLPTHSCRSLSGSAGRHLCQIDTKARWCWASAVPRAPSPWWILRSARSAAGLPAGTFCTEALLQHLRGMMHPDHALLWNTLLNKWLC